MFKQANSLTLSCIELKELKTVYLDFLEKGIKGDRIYVDPDFLKSFKKELKQGEKLVVSREMMSGAQSAERRHQGVLGSDY